MLSHRILSPVLLPYPWYLRGIQQIVVRYPEFRAVDLRSKVLNIKLAGHSSPIFAKQTVDATKRSTETE